MTAATVAAAAGLMLSVTTGAGITITVRTMDAETTGVFIMVETTDIIRGIMLRPTIRKPIMRQAITWSDARFAVFTITMATGPVTAVTAAVSVSA